LLSFTKLRRRQVDLVVQLAASRLHAISQSRKSICGDMYWRGWR